MAHDKHDLTLVLIKPDALKNSLTGYILSQLSEAHSGLRFAAAKIVNVNPMLARVHYAEHQEKVFFQSLIDYLMGKIHYPKEPEKRRVIALVYMGPNAVDMIRGICGPTNPHVARDEKAGSIRALGTVVRLKDEEGHDMGDQFDNLIHASATPPEAEREIKLWFKPNDIPPLMRGGYETAVSEAHYYYHNGELLMDYVAGSICLLAPGDVTWKSDLDILHAYRDGRECDDSLEFVAAKYTINEHAQSEQAPTLKRNTE